MGEFGYNQVIQALYVLAELSFETPLPRGSNGCLNIIGFLSSDVFDEAGTEYLKIDAEIKTERISTEELLEVSSEDRLYWWREDGDVVINSIVEGPDMS